MVVVLDGDYKYTLVVSPIKMSEKVDPSDIDQSVSSKYLSDCGGGIPAGAWALLRRL